MLIHDVLILTMNPHPFINVFLKKKTSSMFKYKISQLSHVAEFFMILQKSNKNNVNFTEIEKNLTDTTKFANSEINLLMHSIQKYNSTFQNSPYGKSKLLKHSFLSEYLQLNNVIVRHEKH